MGAIEIEVKILRGKTPVLVTWENPVKKVVESLLVTCECQGLGLDIESSENKATTTRTTRASNLAHALEVAEAVTCTSLDPLESLANHLRLSDEFDVMSSNDRWKCLSKRRKSKRRKKSRREKGKLSKNAKTDILVNTVNSSFGSHNESDVGTDADSQTNAEREQNQEDFLEDRNKDEDVLISINESQSNLDLLEKCPDGHGGDNISPKAQKEESMKGQPVDEISTDCLQQSYLEARTNEGDENLLNQEDYLKDRNKDEDVSMSVNESESNLDLLEKCPDDDDHITSNAHIEESTKGNPVDEISNDCLQRSDIEAGTDEGDENLLNDTSNKVQQLTGTVESYVHIANLANVVVIPASPTSALSSSPDDQVIMNALNIILEAQPETNITETRLTPDIRDMSANTKVKVIRKLTEQERQKMFLFRSDSEKKNRYELENNGKAFLCECCGKILSYGTRKKHLETHMTDRERNNVCEICGKAFHKRQGLKHHLETHDDNITFDCRYCSKKYKTMYGRTRHERQHFAINPEKCEKCGEKFKDLDDLKNHLKSVHKDDETDFAPIRQSRRGRPAGTKEILHDGQVGTTTCNICQKVVLNISLRGHLRTHDGKMYTCLLCGKVMAQCSKYSHMMIHTGQKDHKCDICSKRFANRPALTVHTRTHTGERPIKCRYCDRGFTRHSSREVHESTHTGDRPFKCTICIKSWKDRSSYGTHMRKNHPGEPLVYKRLSAQINSQQGKLSRRLDIY